MIKVPNMAEPEEADRARIRRAPTRAIKEAQTLHDIIDQAEFSRVFGEKWVNEQ